MTQKKIPFICIEHPAARILHSWDEKHSVVGGYPAGTGTKHNHRWACSICMRELSEKKK